MTGALYRLAQWCLSVLPVDAAGRRVFDETMADWRKEAANANGVAPRALVTVRAMCSVLRSVVMISAREVGSREGMASLRRLAMWSIASVLLFMAFNWNQAIWVQGNRAAVGPAGVALGSVAWAIALMPLLAFLSGATGRRQLTPGPRLGPGLVMSAVMFGAVGWGLPAANQAYRELVFAITSGGGTIAPSTWERSIVELVGLLFTGQLPRAADVLNTRLLFVIAVPVLLALGTSARSLAGWRRIPGSVLPLLIFGIPLIAQIDHPYRLVMMWPALLAAALVTRALVRRAQGERDADRDGSVSPGTTA